MLFVCFRLSRRRLDLRSFRVRQSAFRALGHMAALHESSAPEEDESRYHAQVTHVFQALCTYLIQEVSLGRTVHVPNLGVFFSHSGPPRSMRFKVLEKVLPADLRWEGPGPSIGPISKVRLEKIAGTAGLQKDVAEEMVQSVVKEFWTAVKESPEVQLDLPGIGQIKVKSQIITFEPFDADSRISSSHVTAEHHMFGTTGAELLKRMTQTTRSQTSLFRQERERLQTTASDTLLSPESAPSVPQDPELRTGMRKSSSTPVLKPLHQEASVGEVPFPKKGRKDRTKLASLKEDAEALSRRFTRQLPVSERLFPPLLDRCSRTRSALFREAVERDHISNVPWQSSEGQRIGRQEAENACLFWLPPGFCSAPLLLRSLPPTTRRRPRS